MKIEIEKVEVDKGELVITLKNSGVKEWTAYSMVFLRANRPISIFIDTFGIDKTSVKNKSNCIIKGYLSEITALLKQKKQEFDIKYFGIAYLMSKKSNRTLGLFSEGDLYLRYKTSTSRNSGFYDKEKKNQFISGKLFDKGRKCFFVKRLPNKWIPELDAL